jgi:hypothetical protein
MPNVSSGLLIAASLALVGPPPAAASQDPAPARAHEARAQRSVPTPLAESLPALADHSTWQQDVTYGGGPLDKSRRGVYPVGNGSVFTAIGLGERANTMQAITGPEYQTEEVCAPKGHFGEATLELFTGGRVLDLPEQSVRRVRGANFVVTSDEAPGRVALRTLTFAAPETTAITRVIEVANLSGGDLAGLSVRARVEGPVRPAGDALYKEYDRGRRACSARFVLAGGRTDGDVLAAAVPLLPPGGTWRAVFSVATASGLLPPDAGAGVPTLEAAAAGAGATLAWWQSRLAGTTYFDTDHAKLRDLFHDWKVLLLVQRCNRSGAVSPMVNYRGCWLRDSTGPMLLFLRFNMWAEAKDLLEYLFDCARLQGRVSNHVPLDLDVGAAGAKPIDWNAIAVDDSETPSWFVLMHHWYWRVTRDADLIKRHWPLIERCLKGQKRREDVLLNFHGDESELHGAFYSLYPERAPADCQFIADDRWAGRRPFSFASSVLFLLAVHAVSDMLNGLDEVDHPERYAGDQPPTDRPGQRYLAQTFSLMEKLERAFWFDAGKYFAPALSPLTRRPHSPPYAYGNLMPLWVGWTFPTGEKSSENLRHALARLWSRDGRVGMTPTTGYACGHTQGMLLVALAERDCARRLDALDALLAMAEPAGEWGELYDERGRPVSAYDAAWPNRLRPWESGINLDAILFAISGIRFATVPNWDNRDIRAELRLPHGATFVTMKGVRKDGRDLDVYWRETMEPMTAKELEDNAKKEPEAQRDPAVKHRRVRFHVDLNSPDPKKGYYDLGLNAAGTLFVRYLSRQMPADEMEFWTDDKEVFLRPEGTPAAEPAAAAPARKGGAEVLYLSARDLAGELVGDDPGVTLFDTGLPFPMADLAALLLDEAGKPLHRTVFLDRGFDDPGRTTFKPPAFWRECGDLLSRYEGVGGTVVRADFLRRFRAPGNAALAAMPDGRLELPADLRPRGAQGTVELTAEVSSDADREVVLRVGSGTAVEVAVEGGAPAIRQERPRWPMPDQDSAVVRLRQGRNRIAFVVRGGGDPILFARVTDARGLPVPGVEEAP